MEHCAGARWLVLLLAGTMSASSWEATEGATHWKPGYQPREALLYRDNKSYDKLTD